MTRRYVVVGAGAIGGTIGGRLHQAGHDVVLVARGAHGEAIRRNGLLLRDPDASSVLEVPSVASPSELTWRGDDVAVIATKSHDADVALVAVADAAPPSIAVVCATNGVEAERLALRRFASVHGLCVMLPAAHVVPGEVAAYSAPVSGILDVGRYPDGHDGIDEQVAAAFSAATFASRPVDDVMARKRQKLLLNLANVLDAACPPGTDTSDIYAAARAEALACFAASAATVASDEEDMARRNEAGLAMRPIDGERRGGGSTWQSLARGLGSTEADHLNGEIVLLGRLVGVHTPVNEVLQALARGLASTGAPPDSVDPEEIRRRIASMHA
jgi:2-dehydropantoate 2-reductase